VLEKVMIAGRLFEFELKPAPESATAIQLASREMSDSHPMKDMSGVRLRSYPKRFALQDASEGHS
jgi:hypothetical protein